MPIPFIFGAAAAASAIVGAVQAIAGAEKLSKAQKITELAKQRYQKSLEKLEIDRQQTNNCAQEYVNLQLDINKITLKRFINLMNRCYQQRNPKLFTISSEHFEKYKLSVHKAEEFSKIVQTSLVGGTAVSQSIFAFAGIIGTASTGTAISSLGGAAATNATLAWLGGGSLATGGGGMVLGSLVLGGVTLGSALMLGGFIISDKGDEALEKAKVYEVEINQAIKEIELTKTFLKELHKRIRDLSALIANLNNRAIKLLDRLDNQSLEIEKHNSTLQSLTLLIKTLEKIQKTSILNRKGCINPATDKLLQPNLVFRVQQEEKIKLLLCKTATISAILLFLSLSGYFIFTKFDKEQKFNETSQYKTDFKVGLNTRI
jgi:hypothetical protein